MTSTVGDLSNYLIGLDAIAAYADLPASEARAAGLPMGSTIDRTPYSTRTALDKWKAERIAAAAKAAP